MTIDDFEGIVETLAGSGVRHINLQPNIRRSSPINTVPFVLASIIFDRPS